MQIFNKNLIGKIIALCTIFLVSNSFMLAQHRGDNLAFQGLSDTKDFGVKALAMGGAFTAATGNLSSLFYNPAGLAKIGKLQVTVSANSFNKQYRENQNYRPDRYFVTLPFYLEGLYIPDPANNGKWDYQLVQDTNYNYLVSEPQLGVDSYSEEAADWVQKKNNFGISNIAAAMPFEISENKFVAALSYSVNNNFYDYDRNTTYLDPHIGYFGYGGDITRVDGLHTLDLHWSDFIRERSGKLNYLTGGLSYELLETVMLGVGFESMWGDSDDRQALVKVGDFLLSNQQRFTFTYVDGSDIISGTSKYSSTKFNLGAIVELNRFRIGLKVDLPYTMSREWNYTESVTDSATVTTSMSGTDEYELPAVFSFGFSFSPVETFNIEFDYEYAPYSKAKANLESNDPTFYNWTNRNIIKFGVEYRAFDFLSLMAGYRSIPQVFVPDGSAITDKGPDANSYTFGFSLDTDYGRLDVAYELRVLKYYDSYFSNTNYAFEKNSNLMFGFTYLF